MKSSSMGDLLDHPLKFKQMLYHSLKSGDKSAPYICLDVLVSVLQGGGGGGEGES